MALSSVSRRRVWRAKAPLRIGLAGGGTDTNPYADTYGGAVLNITLNMYAYATIELLDGEEIVFRANDRQEEAVVLFGAPANLDGTLDLLKGVYNRILRDFGRPEQAFRLSTFVDAPAGSGLGTSSTLVVAVLGAFAEWMQLPLGEYDMAALAYEIERVDLAMAGGRQDQYAATFGGVNFMEFGDANRVVVNPLRVRSSHLHELSNNLLLYHMGTSRMSSEIIETQAKNVAAGEQRALEGMHKLKEQAYLMKEAVLKGQFDQFGELLDFGWRYKKQLASGVSNPHIDEIYEAALACGAVGGKVTGAGGGGYLALYCPDTTRHAVMDRLLDSFGGRFERYEFCNHGLISWSV